MKTPNPYPLIPNPYPLIPIPYPLIPNPYPLIPNPYPLIPNPYPLIPIPYPLIPIPYLLILLLSVLLISCKQTPSENQVKDSITSIDSSVENQPVFELTDDFKDYWYAGTAEITSYDLQQARYGELREGHAVLIYVTEDFLPEKQVKADQANPENISVLKLNATKKFNTGIYPYSVMQSTFYPVSNDQHAIKLTFSMQEWCGHVYAQLNNRDQFEINSYSYFESEADQELKLDKTILENELWTQMRLDPSSLPQGNIKIVPAFEYIRLKHIDIKAYNATAILEGGTYTLNYPDLDRSLSIDFNPVFPYEILGWQETYKSGFGPNAQLMTTQASKRKSLKSAYWGQNSNDDEILRESLQLD